MINTKTSLSLFFVLASLVACDDDAKKYTAEFPRFEPLQLKLAENELPKVGKSVVVEAPQRKMGKHLNGQLVVRLKRCNDMANQIFTPIEPPHLQIQ